MANVEQLEAERVELEKKYQDTKADLIETKIELLALVSFLAGMCAGFALCWLFED